MAKDKSRISQMEVRDVDWDHELGSNLLDMALARHFTAEFAAKHKLDLDAILSNAKAMAKMKRQARRTKEILSANNAAPMSVEEFLDGKDFQVERWASSFCLSKGRPDLSLKSRKSLTIFLLPLLSRIIRAPSRERPLRRSSRTSSSARPLPSSASSSATLSSPRTLTRSSCWEAAAVSRACRCASPRVTVAAAGAITG